MPYKSQAQRRWMFAAEDRGEVPKGTAKRWAEHTKKKKLPEKVKKEAVSKMEDSAYTQVTLTRFAEKTSSDQDLQPTETEKLAAVLGMKTGGGDKWAKGLLKKMKKGGKKIPLWLSRINGGEKE